MVGPAEPLFRSDMMSRPTAVLDYTDLGIVGHEN